MLFRSLILDVLGTGDPRRQQALQAKVERIATARGFRDVYHSWTGGEIDRAMALRFDERNERAAGVVGRTSRTCAT